jgi:hypothetical protein
MRPTSQRTILVEVRKDPICATMLDAMADTCQSAGHRVVRWRGPLSGRMPYGRALPVCDLAILFNGDHRRYRPALARLQAWGAATLMVELGWHPQAGHYQVDPQGVNASASWAKTPLEVEGNTPLPVRATGDLLVLTQLDDDTQITNHSPHFRSMEEFVRFVCSASALPVRVRPHPKTPDMTRLREAVRQCGASWDDSPTLNAALQACRAAACVNSSAAVAALESGLPVLCYGSAIYRHRGVVYCLDGEIENTRAATGEILQGRTALVRERLSAMVRRIVGKQWSVADVPGRLPAIVSELLAGMPQVDPKLTSSDRVERTISWFADLPAKLLYRKRLKPRRAA